MTLSDIENEDMALIGAIVVALLAAFIDAFYDSEVFKALKILSLLLSLWLAFHRIKLAKPFVKDIDTTSWKVVGQRYEVRVEKSEHGRGKTPQARCLGHGPAGGYTELAFDASEVIPNGDVVVISDRPSNIRLEIRK